MRTYYIYRATNKITQESYIGQTSNFRNRKWQHERCYKKEKCKFHDAIEKYGTNNFEWEILETCDTRKKALKLERNYITLIILIIVDTTKTKEELADITQFL